MTKQMWSGHWSESLSEVSCRAPPIHCSRAWAGAGTSASVLCLFRAKAPVCAIAQVLDWAGADARFERALKTRRLARIGWRDLHPRTPPPSWTGCPGRNQVRVGLNNSWCPIAHAGTIMWVIWSNSMSLNSSPQHMMWTNSWTIYWFCSRMQQLCQQSAVVPKNRLVPFHGSERGSAVRLEALFAFETLCLQREDSRNLLRPYILITVFGPLWSVLVPVYVVRYVYLFMQLYFDGYTKGV